MAVEVLMPSLDPSMTQARIVKWLKSEGDSVALGEALVEIETDKAVVEVESEAKGSFGKALVAAGDYAPVNAVIGLLLADGESASALADYSAEQKAGGTVEDQTVASADTVATDSGKQLSSQPPEQTERIFASPLARRLTALEGLDLAALSGSGPNGRIVKRDIEAALAAKPAPIAAPTQVPETPLAADLEYLPSYETIELTSMRKTIARRLTESSQQVPHYFLSVDCELDRLLALRKELNARLEAEGRLSLNDFIVRAVALAMKKVPDVNVMWTGDSILRFDQVDISVAVSIDGGLITPVVRKADGKGLEKISQETKALAAKAREGMLVPEDYLGGTFTISNLGMYGIKNFTSIINPPQGGILSIGAGEQRPVVKDGELVIATLMTVTLAADHRCIDGAVGSQFLAAFKALVETPITMLL